MEVIGRKQVAPVKVSLRKETPLQIVIAQADHFAKRDLWACWFTGETGINSRAVIAPIRMTDYRIKVCFWKCT